MRYFFHFRSSRLSFDDTEGIELADNATASEEGRISARQVLGLDNGGRSRRFAGGRFEIVDANGISVTTVTLRASELA